MTAIGINATALMGQAGSFVSVKVSQVAVQKGDNFESVFASKMSTSKSDTTDKSATAINQQKTEYSKGQADNNEKPEAVANNAKTADSSRPVNDAPKAETDPASKAEGSITEENEISDEELASVLEVINTMMQGIAQILEVSLRELQGSFEELNILPKDLVNFDKMAELVLQLNGSNQMTDMLVDENMLNMFNQIKDLVNSILEDNGFTEMEFEAITSKEMFEPESLLKLLDENGLFKLDAKNIDEENPQEVISDENDAQVQGFKVEVVKTDDKGGDEEKSDLNGKDTRPSTPIRRQTDDNRIATPAETFVKGIENAVKSLDMPVADTQVTVRDIVYQLVDAVKVEISPDNTNLEMSLHPESLGRVSLNISSKDGVMTAQITTENQVSKEALESQLQILKENIEAQGVRVEAIEVTVSSFMFSDSKNAQSGEAEETEKGKRTGASVQGVGTLETDPAAEAEELKRKVILENGSTVTYVA